MNIDVSLQPGRWTQSLGVWSSSDTSIHRPFLFCSFYPNSLVTYSEALFTSNWMTENSLIISRPVKVQLPHVCYENKFQLSSSKPRTLELLRNAITGMRHEKNCLQTTNLSYLIQTNNWTLRKLTQNCIFSKWVISISTANKIPSMIIGFALDNLWRIHHQKWTNLTSRSTSLHIVVP